MAEAKKVKATNIWHGDYVGDGSMETQDFRYNDRKALLLVAKVTKDVKQAGGSVVVSRNFGMGPAKIVLVLPAPLEPSRFFDDQDVVWGQPISANAPSTSIDSQIKDIKGDEIVREPVSGEGSTEAQSPKEG